MNRLLTNGELYFNTYKKFRIQEENEKFAILKAFENGKIPPAEYLLPYRRDDYEGLEKTFKGSLKLKIKEKELFINKASLNFFQNTYSHLYCMYAISNRLVNDSYLFDKRNIQFGESAVFIVNPNEFINRIKIKFANENLDFNYGSVIYYNEENRPNTLTPFHKSSYYDFQNEFRITTSLKSSEPYKLEIGNIEDIAHATESEKLSDMQFDIEHGGN